MKTELTIKAIKSIEQKQSTPKNSLLRLMIEMRKLSGMTQLEVAQIIGVGRTSITNIEKGTQPVTVDNLEKLAAHLGLEVVVTVRERSPNN